MFQIKETIAAFLARKGLQDSIWHEALELLVKEQGIRIPVSKRKLRGTDVLWSWASLSSPVTSTLG